MCLLNTLKPAGGTTTDYSFSLDSPESDSTSDSSSSTSSNSKSPPQLSPQNGKDPLYVDLPPPSNEAKNPLISPEMALLTPQIVEEKSEIPKNPDTDTHIKAENDIPKDIIEEGEVLVNEIRKTVPFTFCNMKPNIFDLKKKRGRKPKRLPKDFPDLQGGNTGLTPGQFDWNFFLELFQDPKTIGIAISVILVLTIGFVASYFNLDQLTGIQDQLLTTLSNISGFTFENLKWILSSLQQGSTSLSGEISNLFQRLLAKFNGTD